MVFLTQHGKYFKMRVHLKMQKKVRISGGNKKFQNHTVGVILMLQKILKKFNAIYNKSKKSKERSKQILALKKTLNYFN